MHICSQCNKTNYNSYPEENRNRDGAAMELQERRSAEVK